MASKRAGAIMKHKGGKVVILRTGLLVDGVDAVMIAPLSRTKPSGGTPFVDAKTWVDDYRLSLDRVSVVKAAELVHPWTPPGRISSAELKAALEEVGRVSR